MPHTVDHDDDDLGITPLEDKAIEASKLGATDDEISTVTKGTVELTSVPSAPSAPIAAPEATPVVPDTTESDLKPVTARETGALEPLAPDEDTPDDKIDTSMFLDMPDDVVEGVGLDVEDRIDSSIFREDIGDGNTKALEKQWERSTVDKYEDRFRAGLSIHDVPSHYKGAVLNKVYGKEKAEYVSTALTTAEYVEENGGWVNVANKVANMGLRDVAKLADMLTGGGISDKGLFVTNFDDLFPQEGMTFAQADNVLIDEVVRTLGVTSGFVASGGLFTGATAGVAKATELLTTSALVPKLAQPGSRVAGDIMAGFGSSVKFDLLSGTAYQTTKEVLGEDSEALAMIASLFFPMLVTKDGRNMMSAVSSATLGKTIDVAKKSPGIGIPIFMAENYLDDQSLKVLSNAHKNPEKFSTGFVKPHMKKVAEQWEAHRAAVNEESLIIESSGDYWKEVVDLDNPLVRSRRVEVIAVEDRVNAWLAKSGRDDLSNLEIPVYTAYRGVVDNEGLAFTEATYKQSFPEEHLRLTRDRARVARAYIDDLGKQATPADVAMADQFSDELATAMANRLKDEHELLMPRQLTTTEQLNRSGQYKLQTAEEMRANISRIDDTREDAYVLLTENIERDMAVSSETVFKAIDEIVTVERGPLTSRKDIPPYVLEVYQGIKQVEKETTGVVHTIEETEFLALNDAKKALDNKRGDTKTSFNLRIADAKKAVDAKSTEVATHKSNKPEPSAKGEPANPAIAAHKEKASALQEELKGLKTAQTEVKTEFTAAKTEMSQDKNVMLSRQQELGEIIAAQRVQVFADDPIAGLSTLLPTSTGEVMDAVKRVNKLLRQEYAKGINKDDFRVKNFTKIRKSLEDTMQGLGGPEGERVLRQWERGNNFYKQEIADPIDSTVLGAKFISRSKDGKSFQYYAEDVAEFGWDSANIDDIRNVIKVAGDTKATEKVLREFDPTGTEADLFAAESSKILTDYRDLAMSSLMTDLASVENRMGRQALTSPDEFVTNTRTVAAEWMDKHAAKLKLIPGLQREIDTLLVNQDEVLVRLNTHNELKAFRKGEVLKDLLRVMGHSSNISSIITKTSSTAALAEAIEGILTGGMPKVEGVALMEAETLRKVLGLSAAGNFKSMLARNYKSSLWDSTANHFDAARVMADLKNPQTKRNLELLIGKDEVDILESVAQVQLRGGIEETVEASFNLTSGQSGLIGSIMDSALDKVNKHQRRITSLGSLALRRARGFVPSAEYFQIYLATGALKYMGHQGSAQAIKAVITNHRKLGDLPEVLADVMNSGSYNRQVNKIVRDDLPWVDVPQAFKSDVSTALRKALNSIGLHIPEEDMREIIEHELEANGGKFIGPADLGVQGTPESAVTPSLR